MVSHLQMLKQPQTCTSCSQNVQAAVSPSCHALAPAGLRSAHNPENVNMIWLISCFRTADITFTRAVGQSCFVVAWWMCVFFVFFKLCFGHHHLFRDISHTCAAKCLHGKQKRLLRLNLIRTVDKTGAKTPSRAEDLKTLPLHIVFGSIANIKYWSGQL